MLRWILTRHLMIYVFLTFVWLPALAAPKVTTQLPGHTFKDNDPLKSGRQNDSVMTSAKSERVWAFFVQYYAGTPLEKDETYNKFHYGVQGSFRPLDLRVSIHDKTAALSASVPNALLSPIPVSESIEPFYRWGIDWFLKTSDGLEFMANTKRLQAFGSLGLKDVGLADRRFSLELGLGLGLNGLTYHGLIGIHF
ncbi:MAG: hypothetical protein ACK5P5_11370 [Pseudobdellovibrionaceae bacterium]